MVTEHRKIRKTKQIAMTFILILLFFIFLTLGVIHFYWAKGGKWAFKNAIPTKENGDLVLNPRTIDSIMVGLYLTIIAVFYLLQLNILKIDFPSWTNYILWIIPTVFLLRAIGDFKYVGFFKRTKTTLFAKWDRKLFSPLCLAISFLGFMIAYFN